MENEVKTVVCYGDSNTWGAFQMEEEWRRYGRDVRWPSVLDTLLGDGVEVRNEGLIGRTLVAHDSKKPHRTGIRHLTSILKTSDPTDLVLIMLGTNDMKTEYDLTANDIFEHLRQTITLIRKEGKGLIRDPKILIICPPRVIFRDDGGIDERMARVVEISKELPVLFQKVANETGCAFIDAGMHIQSSGKDGYHLDPEAHRKLASVVADEVRSILS